MSLWRQRDFLRLWGAQAISAFGARIARDGLPLAAVLAIDARPAQLGLLAALATGPQVLVGLTAGGLVDRSRRRRIMIVSDLGRAAVLASVPLAAWLHLLTITQLYLVAAAAGVGNVLFDLADHALLPSLVARERLVDANAKLSLTDSLAEIGGPAIAGVLVQLLTAPIAIAANAASYLGSALLLGAIRRPGAPIPAAAAPANWLEDLRAGFGAIFGHPLLRPIWLMGVTASLFGSIFAPLYVYFAIKILGLTPAMLGLTIAAGGVGALAGALAGPWLARQAGLGVSIVAAAALTGVFALLIPQAKGTPATGMALLVVSQLGGDALAVAAAISIASVRQSVLPSGLLGRVGAAFHVGQGAAATAGALAGGLLGENLGVRPAMVIAAFGVMAAAVWGLASPLPRLRDLPTAA